jgi:hypothetical protein
LGFRFATECGPLATNALMATCSAAARSPRKPRRSGSATLNDSRRFWHQAVIAGHEPAPGAASCMRHSRIDVGPAGRRPRSAPRSRTDASRPRSSLRKPHE